MSWLGESRTRRHLMRAFTANDIMAPAFSRLTLLGAWFVTTAGGRVSVPTLPTPTAVFRAAGELFATPNLWLCLGNTLVSALAGTLLGLLFSMPLTFAVHHFHRLNAVVQLLLGASQAIPAVALAPLLLIWLPASWLAAVVFYAVMVFLPILVSTTVGLRHLPVEVLEVAKFDGANTWQLLRHMELPLVLPSLMGGTRNGITLPITGAVVGEIMIGGHGMETLTTLQSYNVDTAGMFASLFTTYTLTTAIYLGVYQLERRSKSISTV